MLLVFAPAYFAPFFLKARAYGIIKERKTRLWHGAGGCAFGGSMSIRSRLFLRRDPYSREGGELFLDAMRETLEKNAAGSKEYAEILGREGFSHEMMKTENDLARLPALPTLYFKRNRLFCVPRKKLIVRASSSGTSGSASEVGFDLSSLLVGLGTLRRFFRFHRVTSLIPTNYIVLGYEPAKHNRAGAVKTAYLTTKFAPALRREYALKDNGAGYDINTEGIRKALLKYAKSPFPVRFVGFPAYMYFLLKTLEKEGISLSLPARSAVLLGGGWKEFSGESVDREALLELVEARLGIKRERCFEFFSAVEHPLAYLKCACGRFHIPAYSRVIIRDTETLEPIPNGEAGLLNLITPLVSSMPLCSVITDDIAILSDSPCPCGNPAPYFELLARAGVNGIRICAAEAGERLVDR